MKNIIIVLIAAAIIISGIVSAAPRNDKSSLSEHGIALMPVSPGAALVFEDTIRPWIQTKFAQNISDELLEIRRGLLYAELYRYEVVQGQERYSVHIEWAVRMKDRATGMEKATVRGQEIIFLVEGREIKDFFPFDEYIISS